MERFVERFRYKATKARQAQSKLKGIERIKAGMAAADPRDQRTLAFSFGAAERSGRVVLELEQATVAAGDRTLIDDGAMWLERGEHVTLVGANGSGKTTLVETLAGNRELARRQAASRPQRQPRLPLAAHRGRWPRRRDPALPRPAPDRALGGEDAGAARALPVLRRGRAEAARRHLRRRGAAARARAADALRREPADPRRADQPPRRREPRGARGRAHRLRRDGAADLSRPGSARGGRQPHRRDRGRRAWSATPAAGPSTARASRTRRPRAAAPQRTAEADAASGRRRARTAAPSWRGSSARSKRPRRRSSGSRTSSPTRRTGPTRSARRRPAPATSAPARSSTSSSPGGRPRRNGSRAEVGGGAQPSCIGGLVCEPPGRMRSGSGGAASAGCSTPSSSASSPDSSISSTMSQPPTSSPLT